MRGAWGRILPQGKLREFHSIHLPWKSNWSKASTWQHVTGEEYAPETAGVHTVLLTPVVFGTQIISPALSAFLLTQLPLTRLEQKINTTSAPAKSTFMCAPSLQLSEPNVYLRLQLITAEDMPTRAGSEGDMQMHAGVPHEGVKAADHVLFLWTHL